MTRTPTLLQKCVQDGASSVHALRQLGYRLPEIEAAVRRGELSWLRDGRLEVS